MELIYPELSYKLVGLAFKIFNEFGYGMAEKFYQQAFAKSLAEEGFKFQREKLVRLKFLDAPIGKYFLDFVVDEKIVVELKVKPQLGYIHIKQVTSYLKSAGYHLAILIYFTRDGVKYRRILNAI